MTAAQTEILSDQSGYRKTAGERLRRARELKGLSQKDVANALNLMVSHVRAIESNRYDAQAEGEHFGGYLRSYARLVDLDPQQIIELYMSQSQDSGADTVVLSPSPVQLSAQQHSRFKPGISIGFFAVVCLAVAVWVLSRFGVFDGDAEQPQVAAAQQEEAAALQEEALVAPEPVDKPATTVDEPERKPVTELRKPPAILERPTTGGKDEVAESASPAETSSAPERQAPDIAAGAVIRDTDDGKQSTASSDRRDIAESAPQSPAAAARHRRERLAAQVAAERATNASQATLSNIDIQQRATRTNRQSSRRSDREADRRVLTESPTEDSNAAIASGSDQLVLDFTTDCWVEIYDANGKALRLGVERAGDRLMLTGEAPFDVLVGFSRGVTMTLNGEPVPIKQHQFSDSTQLVVGGPDDYFGTQQTYEDSTTIAANESASDELDYVDDGVDEQADNAQAAAAPSTDETRADEKANRGEEQPSDDEAEQLAATDKRVDVPARYSRQFATPAPSTVDELEMAARQINRSPDDTDTTDNVNNGQRGSDRQLVGKQDELEFTFSGECWVEVYDVEKRPLVMETKYAGETLELKGQGPFEVRVGNSRAVSLKVNGQKIEIKRDRYIGSTEFFVGSR